MTLGYKQHRPASHPVLLQQRARKATEDPDVTDALDSIARQIAHMPSVPMTIGQREMGQLIVDELLRRIQR